MTVSSSQRLSEMRH